MATTILDAFVVTLGLDAKGYSKGQADASRAMKKTRDQGLSTARELEMAGKRAGEFFRRMRVEAVGLFLAFQGASSVVGFATNLLQSAANAQRLGDNLGVATGKVAAWEGAIGRVGGKAQEADAALTKIADSYQKFRMTGQLDNQGDWMRLGISSIDQLRDPSQTLLRLAEAAERLPRTEFYARMKNIGMPESLINLLARGRKGVENLIAEQERLNPVSEKAAADSQALQDALNKLSESISGKARPVLTSLTETLLEVDKNVGLVNVVVPVGTGLIVAMGVAAAAANPPLTALATAIAAVTAAVIAYNNSTADDGSFAGGWKGRITDWQLGWAKMQLDRWRMIMDTQSRGSPEWKRSKEIYDSWYKYYQDVYNGSRKGGASAGAPSGAGPVAAPSGGGRSRGERNNNPGNIIDGRFARSQPGYAGSDGRFARFSSYDAGTRAQETLLGRNYLARGYDTVRRVVGRYAPAGENSAASMANYMRHVAGRLGIGVDDRISPAMLPQLAAAMREFETGNYRRRAPSMPRLAAARAVGDRARRWGSDPRAAGRAGSGPSIGTIVINTAATDARGIARDIGGALRQRGILHQSNRGAE